MIFALYEAYKHKEEILHKFSLSDGQFSFILNLMKTCVRFVETEEYLRFLSRAKRTSPDPDDIDFFALALKYDSSIWSSDRLLKKQSKVKVFTTAELLALL